MLVEERKNKSATLQKKVIILKQFFKYLRSREYIAQNPTDAVDGVKIKDADRKKKRTLTLEQSYRLIEKTVKNSVLKDRNRCILLVFLLCGLRVEELCDLKVKDLDFKNKTLFVFDGKGGKNRELPLDDMIIGYLRDYLESRPVQSEYVFTKRHKEVPMNPKAVLSLVNTHSELAGLSGVGCHGLRRTSATHYLAGGAPINSIRLYLGHSSINTTMLYLDPDKEEVKQQLRESSSLAKFMKKKKNKKEKTD
jgi:integrase